MVFYTKASREVCSTSDPLKVFINPKGLRACLPAVRQAAAEQLPLRSVLRPRGKFVIMTDDEISSSEANLKKKKKLAKSPFISLLCVSS